MSALAQHTGNEGAYLASRGLSLSNPPGFIEIAELAELLLDLAEGGSTLAADYKQHKAVERASVCTAWGEMPFTEYTHGMRR